LIERLVREFSVSEELTQDAFLKVFRKLHTFDARQRLSAWILRIAHNTAIDHLRRHRPVVLSFDATVDPERGALVDELPDDKPLPDQLLDQSRTAAAVERALDELRPEYRAVLILRYQEGLDYEEIAEIVNRPIGTVKTFIHRARRALARAVSAMRNA
jgi:RNA polymerase sigma-70 factor (ECF subfamily)